MTEVAAARVRWTDNSARLALRSQVERPVALRSIINSWLKVKKKDLAEAGLHVAHALKVSMVSLFLR